MAGRRLTIVLLLMWVSGPRIDAQRSATITISVVATTDLHGGVLPRGERGGVELFGGYLRNLRAARMRDGGAVLLVDSGDMFQGTLESNLNEGAAVIRAYNQFGYAAAAIGNHEFDFGPAGPDETARKPGEDPRGALKARAAQARFPLLAANTIDDATAQPVVWPNVKPSTLVMMRGVNIGLIGVTTVETAKQTIASNVAGLTFAPLAPAITREAMSLRARGATVVVVLAHAGGRCTRLDNSDDVSSCDQTAEIMSVARELPKGLVDVISAGHTHQAMAQEINGMAIVEAYSTGRSFSRVDVHVNRSSGVVGDTKIFPPQDIVPGRYENRVVRADAAARAAIAPAVRRAAALKNQPLGVHLATPFARGAQQDETAVADLITDGMLASVPGADVAFGNGGSLRADLPAGPLTYGAVYEVYPFDNRLVTLTLTGDQLTRIIAYNLTRTALPTEVLPISGFRVDATCQAGSLQIVLTRTSGARIVPTERLTAVTSDFVATGGDGVLAPGEPIGDVKYPDGAPLLRESVVSWFKSRGGRLSGEQFTSAENRRWHFPMPRPVMCQ
jgi:2',3'-cyclic-nucleotide 2'-phosphodiesterase (5'-nucleotidase family)